MMWLLAAVVVLMLWAGLFSGFETGLYVLDILKLRGRRRSNVFGTRALLYLFRRRASVVTALLVGTNICLFFAASAFTHLLKTLTGAEGEFTLALTAAAIFSPAVVLFSEMLPKDLFRQHSDPLAYRLAPLMRIIYYVLRPVLFVPALIGRIRRPRSDHSAISREEVEIHLTEQLRGDPMLAFMAKNILRLRAMRLGQVMIPARASVTVTPRTPREEAMRLARRHRFSRMVVLDGDAGKKVVGLLHIFDLIHSDAARVEEVMRPALRLGPKMAIDDALLMMRVHRYPMAAVVDDAGDFLGVATVKDIVEEITGEIRSW